jgi:hypothetical protein
MQSVFAKKILWYLLPTVLATFECSKADAQVLDEKTYQHKMQLIDSLSIYNMRDFGTLYKVSIRYGVENYTEDFYGWIRTRDRDAVRFLTVTGADIELEKKLITVTNPLPLDEETIDSLKSCIRNISLFGLDDFQDDKILILWLYEKGKEDYAKRFLPKNQLDWGFSDEGIKGAFGVLYSDAMFSAYAKQRNYSKAIVLGEFLSRSIFNNFEDQKSAIALTRQLKTERKDFKSFRLPDSVEWFKLKQKLSREHQIIYLADRLRLLNCILFKNPGSIDYKTDQYAVSSEEAEKSGFPYWSHYSRYKVINPFSELINMKLSPHEMEMLLPYLLTDIYTPCLEYHRLHKLNWIIESLLFEITGKNFLNQFYFDRLTLDQKKAEVAKIKEWFDENADLRRQ